MVMDFAVTMTEDVGRERRYGGATGSRLGCKINRDFIRNKSGQKNSCILNSVREILHFQLPSFNSVFLYIENSSSFLGSTAQLRPWPPPQNSAEFLGGFSTIFFFTG
jgi:hypothetical protein